MDAGGLQRTATNRYAAPAEAVRVPRWLRDEKTDTSLANRELQPL